jgi:lysophospholipase L1-like esterase
MALLHPEKVGIDAWYWSYTAGTGPHGIDNWGGDSNSSGPDPTVHWTPAETLLNGINAIGFKWYYTAEPHPFPANAGGGESINPTPGAVKWIPAMRDPNWQTPEHLARVATDGGLIIGYNEPWAGFANVSPSQALDGYAALQSLPNRLAAPSVSSMPEGLSAGWMDAFMNGVAARGYRIDVMNVHYYWPTPDLVNFRSFLDRWHTRYGPLPIIVTEWALADWNNLPSGASATWDQQAAFAVAGTNMMDTIDYVELHSWFGQTEGGGVYLNSGVMNQDGSMTVVGQAFNQMLTGALSAPPSPPSGPTLTQFSEIMNAEHIIVNPNTGVEIPAGGSASTLSAICNARHINRRTVNDPTVDAPRTMAANQVLSSILQSSPALVTGTTGMPSGALGIWYADQYSSPGIPNSVGSTALTTSGTADGNLYLEGGTAPSGGAVDFNSGEHGTIVLPGSVTLAAATVIYSCSKVADSTGVHVIAADRASYHFWSAGEDVSGFGPGFQIFSSEYSGQQNGSLWDKVGNGWHISSLSYDASSSECWIDGIKVLSRAVTPPSHTLLSFDIGQVAGTQNAGYKINALAIYPRKLSAIEQASAYAVFKARAAVSGVTIPSTSPEKILFAMGDSITDGSFGNTGIGAANPGYVYAAARSASPVIRGGNLGVGGRTIATTNTAFDETYGPMISAAVAAGGGRDIICTMALGTNDLLTYSSVSAWLTDFATLCDKVRATGAKLIVATIIPDIDPTFNSRRATVNTAIRGWVGTHADAIMDFASDSIMGLDVTPSGGTYFQDGTHPTGAGHARLAPYLVAAINSL